MGQYGNQPDFGTKATNAPIYAGPDVPELAEKLNSAALYIGSGGTLVCRVVGGNANLFSENPNSGFTIFRNIPDGTFFPVIVDCIWQSDGESNFTTCLDIVALY